ncbi:MAG TPA: hypothetical protein VF228_08230 [Iamia sp.]
MRREIALWKVVAAALALLAVSSGSAVALAASGGSPAAQAPPDSRGTLTPTRSTTFVPVTPCRIASTTPASIPAFGVEQSRTFKVAGNLSSQGGQAAGCGIPNAATGIEASISATNNQGAGYVRAWPANQGEPLATILNYTAAGASTNTGALTIVPGGGNAFTVKNYGSVADIVIDVQGYYVRPMYVLVNPNGSVEASSRYNFVQRNGIGQYEVDFQVDTDTCVRTVSVGRSRTSDVASSGFASAHISENPANRIVVTTYDTAGNLADRAFMVEITC